MEGPNGGPARGAYPACSISPIPTTSSPAAAILGAPNRSLKNTAPMAAPTMIDVKLLGGFPYQPAMSRRYP
jgi:hypothetical protein